MRLNSAYCRLLPSPGGVGGNVFIVVLYV